MTAQPGLQSGAMQILLSISRSKSNQALKFRQITKNITKEILFLKNRAEN